MRRELDYRPLVVSALAFLIGLTVPYVPWHVLFGIALIGFLRSLRGVLIVSISVFLGAWLSPPHIQLLEQPIFVSGQGTVASVPDDRGLFALNIEGYRLSADLGAEGSLSLGDTVAVMGVAKPWEIDDLALKVQGLVGKIRLDPSQVRLIRHGSWLPRLADAWRKDFRRFTKATLGVADGGFVDAFCFNNAWNLPPDFITDMKITGTIHLISASGFHVFVFASVLGFIFSFLPVPHKVQLIALGAILFLYCFAAGLDAPIVRSVAMAFAWRAAYLFGRERDFLSALGGAALLILVWHPYEAWSPGFQLSFVTVAGLALFTPRGGGPIVEAVNGTTVAVVTSTPLVAYHFGMVSVVAIPANLAIIIPASLVVGVSLTTYPLGWSWPMEFLVRPSIDWIRWVITKCAEPTWAWFPVPEFSAYFLLAWYLACFSLWRPRVVRA